MLKALKALDCYRFQTAGDPEEWRESEPAALVGRLESEAITWRPAWEDRPGWPIEDRDVFRAG